MMAAVVGLTATILLAGLCALAGFGAGIRKGFVKGYQQATLDHMERRGNQRRTH